MSGTTTYNYPIQSLSLDIQNPQIPGNEVFETPKNILWRCLGVQNNWVVVTQSLSISCFINVPLKMYLDQNDFQHLYLFESTWYVLCGSCASFMF